MEAGPDNSGKASGPTTRHGQGGQIPATQSSRGRPAKTDHTILKPPIATSVTGMKQAVFALENSTPEIRGYLINECNLIYECKCCLSLFRSLANFIAHKRGFCREKFRDRRHVPRFDGDMSNCPSDMSTLIVAAEEPVDTIVPDDFDLMDYCPSLELMKDLGIVNELENVPLMSNLKPPHKKTIEKVVQNLKAKVDSSFDADYYKSKQIRLESMRWSSKGVFQTSMGEQFVDLERAKGNRSAVVDPFNRALYPGDPSPEFQDKLFTLVTDNPERNVRFSCIRCKKSFGKIHTVVQHLIRTHKFSQEEANRQKHAIKKSKFTVVRKAPIPILSQSDFDDIMSRDWIVRLRSLTKAEIKRWTRGPAEAPSQRLPIIPSLTPKLHLQLNGNSQKVRFDVSQTTKNVVPAIVKHDVYTIDDDDDDDDECEVTFVDASASVTQENDKHEESSLSSEPTSSSPDAPLQTMSRRRKPEKTDISQIVLTSDCTDLQKKAACENETETVKSVSVIEIDVSTIDVGASGSVEVTSDESLALANTESEPNAEEFTVRSASFEEKIEISQTEEKVYEVSIETPKEIIESVENYSNVSEETPVRSDDIVLTEKLKTSKTNTKASRKCRGRPRSAKLVLNYPEAGEEISDLNHRDESHLNDAKEETSIINSDDAKDETPSSSIDASEIFQSQEQPPKSPDVEDPTTDTTDAKPLNGESENPAPLKSKRGRKRKVPSYAEIPEESDKKADINRTISQKRKS